MSIGPPLQSWLYALDDAVLLLDLVRALEAPPTEWLPLRLGSDASVEFESPMSKVESEQAIEMLVHCAVHIAVQQVYLALTALVSETEEPASGASLNTVVRICQLFDGSYKTDPYAPVWRIGEAGKDCVLRVPDVITINTKGLDAHRIRLQDFGGAEAIQRLLQFTRALIAER